MAKYHLSLLLFRLVLPAGLLISIGLRPYGLSMIYLLLYLIAPFPQIQKGSKSGGSCTAFLIATSIVSSLVGLVHVAWHAALFAEGGLYGAILLTYPIIAEVGGHLGLIYFTGAAPWDIVLSILPELIAIMTSVVVTIAVKKLLGSQNAAELRRHGNNHQQHPKLTNAGKYLALFLIMFSGIIFPSVSSGIYYLVFMGAATAWALGCPLEKGFAVVCKCVMAIMAVHVAIMLIYQSAAVIELYPPDQNFARYFGLAQLVSVNVTTFQYDAVVQENWRPIVSPLVILVTYFFLAIESRELFKPKLVNNMNPSNKWSSLRFGNSKRSFQDASGSIVLSDNASWLGHEPTLKDDILAAIIEFFQVIIRSSYIATTITMMAWSILFHSWLAFVFLMWACVVWLRQNQRSFMLHTSPLLVLYAELLLLAQYIYTMDLTEAELPDKIAGHGLREIGLMHAKEDGFTSLLIKSLFTCMFWVTLRQLVEQRRKRRQSAVVADMAAPLQLTVSAAASGLEAKQEEAKSRLMFTLGKVLRALCARYWIYIVVIMLFVIGITGERMTIFRIIYMFLFLSFILMFQISWYWWRKLMYVFWIILIIYSMINLILLYVYQFDGFGNIIEQYLFVNKRLQHDLGLDTYPPADLFVKLLTPTCFLIITIMQVHYFHKDFLALSDLRTRSNSKAEAGGASTNKDDVTTLPSENDRGQTPTEADNSFPSTNFDDPSTRRSIREHTDGSQINVPRSRSNTQRSNLPSTSERHSRLTSMGYAELATNLYHRARVFISGSMDLVYLFLYLHLTQIILVALMFMCIMNVCALHVPIIFVIVPATLMYSHKQRIIILFTSVLISMYLMANMVYQIDYIQHSDFEVNCTQNTTYNNAEWFGFYKTSPEMTLASMLRDYIGLIALFTFNSLITYRQRMRKQQGLQGHKEKILFPDIKREDADKDLISCIKYLFNYGFYKFGVEVCLMCLIGVIGSRMDFFACIYAVWLAVLVSLNRVKLARIWLPFTLFVMVLIPIQYLMAVGFLPQICMPFPWSGEDDQMKHIRNWFFLPYNDEPPHASKLVFDFFLLLFSARQIIVFNIEKRIGDNYRGGSNSEDIGKDWETPGFVNPIPDFLSKVNTWLDVIKRLIFLGMLWLTLAMMFLTGANRVNMFSMGYLIGSFMFLWQGTDFYLRPKPTILRWWSWLLLYNVMVVMIKTLLQVPGCIFSRYMQQHCCWLVQLLGIGCVDKFAGGNIAEFLKMKLIKDTKCHVPPESIGLAWDGVCFAFLILQRRLFHSYYFYRVIDESKATTILASRGAELIEELRQKQMKVQDEQEEKILEKIKIKMERIKASQKKIHGDLTKEPRNHDVGSPRCKPPSSHSQAVRSGDYYMFDEFDDTEVQLRDYDSSSEEEGPKEMGLGEIQRRHSRASYRRRDRPTDVDDVDVIMEQRQMEDLSTDDEREDEELVQETVLAKIQRILDTAWAFVASFLVTLTRHLIKFSRDYRYVSRMLSVEKRLLKEQEGFGIGLREGKYQIWTPLPEALNLDNKDVSALEEQDESILRRDHNPILYVAYALWYAILAHTDIVCFIMVFINQIQSATILSIPLPLMVFLWGTLSIPRPTKTFWVTLIAYTEVIVLIKTMFQFEILPWNQKAIPANMPFTAPRIIGIERKTSYATYDLLLLLIIFLHRFMLKSLGLWKETTTDFEIPDDAEYALTADDTNRLARGETDEVGMKYVQLHTAGVPDVIAEDSGTARNQPQGGTDEMPGPSADLENAFGVDDDKEPIIAVTTTLEEPCDNYPGIIMLSIERYLQPLRSFFEQMLAPGARVTADVYAYMFLCDFVNFMVVIFGFAAFGTHQGDGGVQTYLEENKVPIPFLVMLILQFALIVIDRALYLRKYMLGKILFQYALIVGVHIWMFFVLPFITERTFNSLLPPPMWYMVKCVYLLLSAYQIRCGYPRRIIGNFLCNSYRMLNMLCFRGFMAVPFVFELRTLMDWIWTDTSMSLMDWLKMEDIFASVFLLKCSRFMEDKFPQPRGSKKSSMSKYLLGGSVLAFVIAIIWFPLVIFALGNTVGEPNPPTDVTVKIRIGPFLPIYQMSAQSHNIEVYSEQDYNQLSNLYVRDRTAQTFLSNYMYNDVAVVTINPNSTNTWDISPPELQRLENEAISNATLMVKFTYVITHPTNSQQNAPTIETSREVPLEAYINNTRNEQRTHLMDMLAGKANDTTWLHIKTLFPKFVKVFNLGVTKPAPQLMPPVPDELGEDAKLYRDVDLRLEREGGKMYWRVKEACHSPDNLQSIPLNNCDMLVMYTFNDKIFPRTLNFISGGGIIGLYTTFVFLASRVLRGFFSGIYTKIMFDDLPNVDRVLQLCLDIYLVREALELSLEEDLFAKLVFLYRSPETMIKWSRPKEEEEQRALPPSR